MGQGLGYLWAAGWLARAIVLVTLSIYAREQAADITAAFEPIAQALAQVAR